MPRVTVAVCRYGPVPDGAVIAVTVLTCPAIRTSYGVAVDQMSPSFAVVNTSDVATEVTPAFSVVELESYRRAVLSYTPVSHTSAGRQFSVTNSATAPPLRSMLITRR